MSVLNELAASAALLELGSSPAAPAICFPQFPQGIRGFPLFVAEPEAKSASYLPAGQIMKTSTAIHAWRNQPRASRLRQNRVTLQYPIVPPRQRPYSYLSSVPASMPASMN